MHFIEIGQFSCFEINEKPGNNKKVIIIQNNLFIVILCIIKLILHSYLSPAKKKYNLEYSVNISILI